MMTVFRDYSCDNDYIGYTFFAYSRIESTKDVKPYLNRKESRNKRYQKRKGKKPNVYSKFSPKFGVSTLKSSKNQKLL